MIFKEVSQDTALGMHPCEVVPDIFYAFSLCFVRKKNLYSKVVTWL